MLEKINQGLERMESAVIGVILLAMTLLAFTQVLSRYIIHVSFPWLEEAVRFLMFWLCYMGVALLARKSANINIDVLPDFLKKKFHLNIEPLIQLGVLAFTLIFLWYAAVFLSTTHFYAQKSQVMSLPMEWVYSVFVIGNGLAVFHLISNLIAGFKEWRGGQ